MEVQEKMNGRIIHWPHKNIIGRLYFLTEKVDDENKLINHLLVQGIEGVVIDKFTKLDIDKWVKVSLGIIEVENVEDAYKCYYTNSLDIKD